jgi:hypothetical protein
MEANQTNFNKLSKRLTVAERRLAILEEEMAHIKVVRSCW